jgi:hypothetical protein
VSLAHAHPASAAVGVPHSGGCAVGIYYTRTARKARLRAHLADAAAGLLFGARLGALFGLVTLPLFLFH